MIDTIILNGCFDCFHDGHKYLMRYANKLNSYRIIVLLNSDMSVKQLKGNNRPIDTFAIRKEKIKEYWKTIKYTDTFLEIYSFNDELELECLINIFEPDMIIKGSDRPDTREIIGSNRWPVVIIPRIKDHKGNDISTTKLLQEFAK